MQLFLLFIFTFYFFQHSLVISLEVDDSFKFILDCDIIFIVTDNVRLSADQLSATPIISKIN